MGIALDKLPLKLRERVIQQLNNELEAKATPRAAKPSPSQLESSSGNGALEAEEIQGRTGGRVLVRVKSLRTRLLDEDNINGKFLVDLCRYAGILSGDEAGKTKIEVSQEKVGKGEPEKVIIEIYEPIT